MGKKETKDFDVWVTRNHLSNYGGLERVSDRIRVSKTSNRTVECHSGCCAFVHLGIRGRVDVRDISVDVCKERYGFLPRPGECWNVWSVDGVLHHQEWPLTVDDTGKLYHKKGHAKTGHAGEKEYYFALTD